VITAAADGSALGNPGPAGWAWYVDDDCWAAGGWPHATNNQGELTAVLELFRATAHLDDELHVQCDSQYVINTVTKWMAGWKRKGWRKADGSPVLNLELIQELDAVIAGRRYRFEWVRGHIGHPLNEAADTRARAVAEAFRSRLEIPVGPGWTRDVLVQGGLALPDAAALAAPAAGTASAASASAASASAARIDRDDRSPADAALFDFEDPAAEWLTMTLELTDGEHTRLLERARAAGATPEEFLRGLI
jgi:ribonuclease HI